MACNQCASSVFRQKIGRCRRCMLMLAALCLLGWPSWYWLFADTPASVGSIALLFFCLAWSLLLALHLLVWGWRRALGQQ